MSQELDKPIGVVHESTDDRVKCLALEYGLSREELLSWVLGIGITVLEVGQQIPDGKLVYFSGNDFKRITLPNEQ